MFPRTYLQGWIRCGCGIYCSIAIQQHQLRYHAKHKWKHEGFIRMSRSPWVGPNLLIDKGFNNIYTCGIDKDEND